MKASFSNKCGIRPSLEQLETRDMPSTLGAALPFVISRVVVERGLKNSDAWTSNFQNDFNSLQSDIVKFGPSNPTTISDLSKTMADYGFAQQTFQLADNSAELAKAGIAFGISNGFFDESDGGAILFSLIQLQNLTKTTAAQKNTVDTLAHTHFANGVSFGGSVIIADLSRSPYIS
jgi:hypothetical protein